MNHRTSTAGSARRVPDLKVSTVYPRAVPALRLQDNNPPNLAEKIIEASQDLNNLGVSVLGSNDDATLLAEVGWGGVGGQLGLKKPGCVFYVPFNSLCVLFAVRGSSWSCNSTRFEWRKSRCGEGPGGDEGQSCGRKQAADAESCCPRHVRCLYG